MKKFPIELLKPKKAILNAKIFKNDFLKITPTLFYSIEIELVALEIENQKTETTIKLDFINLNIFDLKELENRTFEFPINPENGFVDGSIYLFDVHNPINIHKIEFSGIKNNTIDATIYIDIDFEYENTEFKKLTDIIFTLNIKFGNLSIDTEILRTENFDEEAANKLVSKFSDIKNYEKPIFENQQIIYKML